MQLRRPRLTTSVSLPGGQDRLKQAILYVAKHCEKSMRFGAVKLNKIIWKADFDSFAARGIPVTGRPYKRQKLGPVPYEMPPVHRELEQAGMVSIRRVDLGDGMIEKRTVALQEPDLSVFSEEDIGFLDSSIRHYWNMTGAESSDESHGFAWESRENGDYMEYETSLLSERRPKSHQMKRLESLIHKRQLRTL